MNKSGSLVTLQSHSVNCGPHTSKFSICEITMPLLFKILWLTIPFLIQVDQASGGRQLAILVCVGDERQTDLTELNWRA